MHIDFAGSFAAAVCIGPVPDAGANDSEDYMTRLKNDMALFDRIAAAFHDSGMGEEYDRNAEQIRLLCVFSLDRREDYAFGLIQPLIRKIEKEAGRLLLCGVGLPAANHLHISDSVNTSEDAFRMSFFENKTFFEYQTCRKRSEVSFEDYEQYSERAFKSILMKSPDAICDIDACLDLIGRFHYGNKNAAVMRSMNFTGELAYRLHRYGLLEKDFFQLLDSVQEQVLSAGSFSEVKDVIHDCYDSLLPEIFQSSRTSRKAVVERSKNYIRENYMTDLTLTDLASIACVSPGYFSHMFKEETGVSFKAYLTNVRLDAALELLLGTDYRLYEISEKTGYNNVRNFEEAFRKRYGRFPGDYKKKMMQDPGC